jgi:hypothetical protein
MRRIARQSEQFLVKADLRPEQDPYGALQKPDGGFSYNPIHKTTPSMRYMVALSPAQGGVEHIKHISELTPDHIVNHQSIIQHLLRDPNTFQGGWHNPSDGKVYLDASRQYPDLNSAQEAARTGQQISLFDLHSGKSIPTQQKTSFFIRSVSTPHPMAFAGAHPAIKTVKDSWASQYNHPEIPTRNSNQSMQEADEYQNAPHLPNHPELQKSYQSLIGAVGKQYNDLRSQGISFKPHQGEGEPYQNSDHMRQDLQKGQLSYLQTANAGELSDDHPMRQMIQTHDGPMMANDAFRAVHDALGHGFGASFGPLGEQKAWQNHRATLPAEAHPALYSETRGQNLFTNYGPHMRDQNGQMLPKEQQPPMNARPFGEQKTVYLPHLA